MILAFSTSSRLASVALATADGDLIWSGELDAPQAASGACMKLLEDCREQTGKGIHDAALFAADVGPGSFTGVRVGIVLAKTFGFLFARPCAGVSAFDLIAPDATVILPSKRGEIFIRRPGDEPTRSTSLPDEPVRGNGMQIANPEFPHAKHIVLNIGGLRAVEAERFVPQYLIEPSISVPKRPIAGVNS